MEADLSAGFRFLAGAPQSPSGAELCIISSAADQQPVDGVEVAPPAGGEHCAPAALLPADGRCVDGCQLACVCNAKGACVLDHAHDHQPFVMQA